MYRCTSGVVARLTSSGYQRLRHTVLPGSGPFTSCPFSSPVHLSTPRAFKSSSSTVTGVEENEDYLSEPRPSVLTIGDPSNGKMDPIRVTWTDLVGLDSAPPGTRLGAGRVLAMLDMCAARASQAAADYASSKTKKKYLNCTVGVTNTMFAAPILHGDTVRMDGRVIHCGASSVGVYISFYRRSFSSRKETFAGESFFTMVTITPDLKAARIVPSMDLTDPKDIDLHRRYLHIRKITQEAMEVTAKRRGMQLTHDEVDCHINRGKSMHVKIDDTKQVAHRIFFSSFLNNNNTVFGGELMAWMERHAVHCGRSLTGNRHVFCIGMHSVAFPEPVFATDWVRLEARVIYVRNTTMEVDVTLRAERRGEAGVVTNKASFVLINTNDIGMKVDIPMGIALNEHTPQEDLQLFMEAKERYHRSVQRSVILKKKSEDQNHPSSA